MTVLLLAPERLFSSHQQIGRRRSGRPSTLGRRGLLSDRGVTSCHVQVKQLTLHCPACKSPYVGEAAFELAKARLELVKGVLCISVCACDGLAGGS